jgi:DNA polymerase-3 subunit beta
MRFIVQSSVLLKNLQSISGVLTSSAAMPILENFLFELEDNMLNVTASDLETTMKVTIPLDMETIDSTEPGVVTIPAKKLLESLKTFPAIPLLFNIDPESFQVEITTNDGKYKLAGHSAEEYPKNAELEDAINIEINSDVITNAINKTFFATATDSIRPIMQGVFCELTPDYVNFVATDAHKLVRYRRKDVKIENASSFILPKKPLNQLKNVLSGKDTKVKIEYNERNAFFTFDNFELICRLIDGKYPAYEAVIPTNNPYKLIVDRLSFLDSIRRVSIFSNQSTHQVRLKLTGQLLEISAEDLDFSNEARESLPCNYNGEDMEIGFNSKFLQEMLSNLESDMIALEMSQPNRAGIIYPVDNENSEEDILMLLMPIMLNQ